MVHKINISTRSKVELRDITRDVEGVVRSADVDSGICYVFVPHTTAAVTINEHADPSVAQDIAGQLEALAPQQAKYRHLEGNAPAHIKASLVGSSEKVFVEKGKLVLGTWQGIFFCEFDGPRNRTAMVKIVPDS